jgi:hypothetical protein
VEPDGLFSVAGTRWECIGISFGPNQPIIPVDYIVWFSERTVRTSSGKIGVLGDVRTYLDFLVFSVAWRGANLFAPYPGFMILQPALGVGMFSSLRWQKAYQYRVFLGVEFGVMFKIDDDDWAPPEVE